MTSDPTTAANPGKFALLKSILKQAQSDDENVLICVSSRQVAASVAAGLAEDDRDCVVISEGMDNRVLDARRGLDKWFALSDDPSSRLVPLVVSDRAIDEPLNVGVLVHYDLPKKSKKLFGER